MDLSIVVIAAFMFVVVFYVYVKKVVLPKFKGAIGEYQVSLMLKRLNHKEYLVLNDILLKNGELTTQIDHVVISKKGIFVIETKNYKGWIHGHENSDYWTQTIYREKVRFRNPIKQNWGHVNLLRKVLSDYSSIKYFPIVVFAGKATLKNVTSDLPVIYPHQLFRTITERNELENLSTKQIREIFDKLNQSIIKGRREKRLHIKRVRKHILRLREKERSKVCPKCGHTLVKRKGQFGIFYGCSNYPECRFTTKNK